MKRLAVLIGCVCVSLLPSPLHLAAARPLYRTNRTSGCMDPHDANISTPPLVQYPLRPPLRVRYRRNRRQAGSPREDHFGRGRQVERDDRYCDGWVALQRASPPSRSSCSSSSSFYLYPQNHAYAWLGDTEIPQVPSTSRGRPRRRLWREGSRDQDLPRRGRVGRWRGGDCWCVLLFSLSLYPFHLFFETSSRMATDAFLRTAMTKARKEKGLYLHV